MELKNLVFDLGGVLINLDFQKTANAFGALGVQDFDTYFNQFHANALFKQLETGATPEPDFYDNLRQLAAISASDAAIDEAWNAMLLDFPQERISRLLQLRENYRLFLFSNTNSIHHRAFSAQFLRKFGFELDSLFEKAWYSHLVGHRKPDAGAFAFMLEDAGLAPGQTVFIDDTLPNIEAAQRAGMTTLHVKPGVSLLDLLHDF